MSNHRQMFRRPKECPRADAWHTIRIGMVIFAFLMMILPLVFEALG